MSGWMCRAPKLITGSGARRLDALARGGRPAGRLGQHPEERRLVQPEPAVPRPDPQDDLLGRDDVAVVERLELRLARVGVGEDVAEQVLRLVDAAQDGVLAGEDLHRHERVAGPPSARMRLGAREVDVGRVAGQDLVRRSSALQAHQSGSAPCRGRVLRDVRRRHRFGGGGECSARSRGAAPGVSA